MKIIKLFSIILVIITFVGCSNDNKIAYVSKDDDNTYERTFSELNIGEILSYNLKLVEADNNWVKIWLEGYSNGEKIDQYSDIQLQYGLSPQKGKMGIGIINAHDRDLIFLYAPGVKSSPRETGIIKKDGVSVWGYAIGNETIELDLGETKIIGVYRQDKNSLRTYDYQNEESINDMIKEDDTVLLLKIKIEKE